MIRFTGGDGLTGFAKQLSDLLVKNELGPSNAYALSHADTETSGFSFGHFITTIIGCVPRNNQTMMVRGTHPTTWHL